MKPNRVKQLIMGAFAVAMLLVGVGSTTANAQGRVIVGHRPIVVYRPFGPYWHSPFWNPYWGPYGYTVVNPIAAQTEQGYSDGMSRGKDDAKHDKANAPESHKHYYNSNSLAYREAFLKGYAEGYKDQVHKERG